MVKVHGSTGQRPLPNGVPLMLLRQVKEWPGLFFDGISGYHPFERQVFCLLSLVFYQNGASDCLSSCLNFRLLGRLKKTPTARTAAFSVSAGAAQPRSRGFLAPISSTLSVPLSIRRETEASKKLRPWRRWRRRLARNPSPQRQQLTSCELLG